MLDPTNRSGKSYGVIVGNIDRFEDHISNSIVSGSLSIEAIVQYLTTVYTESSGDICWQLASTVLSPLRVNPDNVTAYDALRQSANRSGSLPVGTLCILAATNVKPKKLRFSYQNTPDRTVIIHCEGGNITIEYSSALEADAMHLERWYVVSPYVVWAVVQGPQFNYSLSITLDDGGEGRLLTFSSRDSESILIPDSDFIRSRGYKIFRSDLANTAIAWHHKKKVMFWRGSSTGFRFAPDGSMLGWRSLQRAKLVAASLRSELSDLYDCGISNLVQLGDHEAEEIIAEGLTKELVPQIDFAKFAYQIDVDGNSNAWSSLFCKLLGGGLVFKVASEYGFRQWFYDQLRPFENYIPVLADLSDLDDRLLWAIQHDDEAQEIALNGQRLAENLSNSSIDQLFKSAVISAAVQASDNAPYKQPV